MKRNKAFIEEEDTGIGMKQDVSERFKQESQRLFTGGKSQSRNLESTKNVLQIQELKSFLKSIRL